MLALLSPSWARASDDAPGASVTVAVSGDILPHASVLDRATALGGRQPDFAPLFAGIRPVIERADLAICHLETPIRPARASAGHPPFNAPPALARGIAEAGWDACSTASNHSLDQGAPGVASTIAALEEAGVQAAGTATGPRAGREPLIVEAGGARIAYLAYTTNTNNNPLPWPWSVDVLTDPERVIADARRARHLGADFVLVNIHWTARPLYWIPDLALPAARPLVEEFDPEPSAVQEALVERLLRADAVSAVVGQGPHTVQPIISVDGKPGILSEGNLIAGTNPGWPDGPAGYEGLVAVLTLEAARPGPEVARIRCVPVTVERPANEVVRAWPRSASYARTLDLASCPSA